MCHKKLSFDTDIRTSLYGTKKFKNFVWKRFFIKTERGGGSYYFDEKFGPISKSVCNNFEFPDKNPQRSKMRVAQPYEDGRSRLNKTYNQMYCDNCGWYEFSENATYIEVLTQK